MPISLLWFALTAVVYVLQLNPFTGIILMMLAAPYWSILTVNVGFASLAFEAATGRVGWLWLGLPIAWIVGYTCIAAQSHIEFNRLDVEIRRANAGHAIAFSPDRSALVFQYKGDGVMSGAALFFVLSYALPVAYETNPNFKTASHLAYRVASKARCARLNTPENHKVGIYTFGFHENGKFIEGMCNYYAPEDPTLPRVLVTAKPERHDDWLLPYEFTRLRLDQDDAAPLHLVSGSAAPLSWWPQPVLGCALNSGAPKWQCFSFFGRGQMQGLGGKGGYGAANFEVIANALGLVASPVSTRRATID